MPQKQETEFQDIDQSTHMRHVIRAIVQQASLSILVNLSLFKFWMWKIVEASMDTLVRADSKAPVCLAQFTTPEDRSGITGGVLMATISLFSVA